MVAKRTSLERGLTSAFALVILVVIAMIPVALFAMNGITQQAQVLHDTIIRGELAYVKVASDADALRAATIDAATNPDATRAAASLARAKALVSQYPSDSRAMGNLTGSDAAVRPLVQRFVGVHDDKNNVQGSADVYDFQALAAVGQLLQGKRADALKQIQGSAAASYDQQSKDGEALLNALRTSSDARFNALMGARTFALTVLILGALVACAIAIVSMGWFRRTMRSGLERCLEVFEAMGRGDLRARVGFEGKDLLGRLAQAVDQLADRLSHTISTIQHAVMTVQNASSHTNDTARQVEARVNEELAALGRAAEFSMSVRATASTVTDNAEQVARRVTDISSAVAEMTASIQEMDQNLLNLATVVEQAVANTQEMSASIVQVAGNAERVRQESTNTDQRVREGRNEVAQLSKGMSSISETVADVVSEMQSLDQASRQIGEILGLIEEIADQTNLLALNAAIEAARAGEHGRGFAVVADEVRKLAENSASSTKQIGLLIKDIQAKTVEVVRSTTASGAKASTGLQMADLAGRAINDILEAVNDASQLIDQISKAAREQASGSSSIVNSVEQMTALMRESVKWLDEQDAANQQMIDAIAAMRQLTERMSGAIERQRAACEAIDQAAKRLETTAETSLEINTSMEEAIRALREQAHGETDGMPPLPDAQPHERLILATGGRN